MNAFLFCILIRVRSIHLQSVFQLFRILLFFVIGGPTSMTHAFSIGSSFPFDAIILKVVTSSSIFLCSNVHAWPVRLFGFLLFFS